MNDQHGLAQADIYDMLSGAASGMALARAQVAKPSNEDQLYRYLVENTSDALALGSDVGALLYANPAMLRQFGHSQEELLRLGTLGIIHAEEKQVVRNALETLLRAPDGTTRFHVRLKYADGTWRWTEVTAKNLLHHAALQGVLFNFRDITEARKLEEELAHQALHDPLTSLPNRRLFDDRLQQALARARRDKGNLALLYIDIDAFKVVNDTYGHGTGDLLLKQIADRLTQLLRRSDTLARVGGDEFAAIAVGIRGVNGARVIAHKLLSGFQEPFRAGSHEFSVTASIGVSLFPDDGDSEELLQHKADIAMYGAKWRQKSDLHFFGTANGGEFEQRAQLESDLRHALERGQLVLYYQPQFELERAAVIGTEALIRWQHPQLGMISPAKFIPVAEETGAIVPIGTWVMQEACRQARDWQQAGARHVKVAVNVSALQFGQADLVRTVAAALEQSGLQPASLELELTESLLMQRIEETAERMQQLRALGVRIALDDFGTGYSSLSQLQTLPIDTIKIDRSFLQNMESRPSSISLVNAIVALAHSLGMTVVAEGIETETQLEHLRSAGCDTGQGFLVAAPAPAHRAYDYFVQGNQVDGKQTILLVEDEEMVLKLVLRTLKKHGYHVLEARNARDALTICKKYGMSIDVLITDVRMPDLSGYDLTRAMKSICSVPVIYVSGYADLEDNPGGGESWFLSKPFTADQLLSAVRNALQRDTVT